MTSPSKVRKVLCSSQKKNFCSHGFTLVELVITITIIGLIFAIGLRSSFSFFLWKQDASIRKLTETIQFLHHQAVTDQAYYRLEFDFQTNSYRAGVLRPEGVEDTTDLVTDAGTLSLELSAYLNPSMGRSFTFIPSPTHPSLFQISKLEGDVFVDSILNFTGEHTRKNSQKASITFSPRGFSEFAVIHLQLGDSGQKTVLVNPFSGLTTVYPGFREFEWTYGTKHEA